VLREGCELGQRIGAPVWAAYAAYFVPVHTIFSGVNVHEALETLERYYLVMELESRGGADGYRQLLKSLSGLTSDPGDMDDADFDADAYIADMKERGLILALRHFYNARQMAYTVFNRAEDALAVAAVAESEGNIAEILFGQLATVQYPFFNALAHAMAATDLEGDERAEHVASIDATIELFNAWAENCEPNFGAQRCLLLAEQSRLAGDPIATLEHYDQAIELARSAQLDHVEAIALERAARYHFDSDRSGMARFYLRNARRKYAEWGASAKVAALENEFRDVLAVAGQTSEVAAVPQTSGQLDLASVLKAARIVSSEIETDKLLDRSMDVVIENAGAQGGTLLLMQDGKLALEASTNIEGDAPYATSVVDYCRRTKEPVVIAEARDDGLFGSDAHIQKSNPRSVLAVPLLSAGKLIGVMYLENRLSAGAFTPERIEVLEALVAQIVVSIENAKLYEKQRLMAESFARFVPQEFLQFLGKKCMMVVVRGDAVREEFTVLFSDLRDFTALSEGLDARDNFEILSDYLEIMEPVIHRHNGFVDKYIGDAIMALFPGSPDDAVAAAIGMQQALDEYNTAAEKKGKSPLRMGIGLHTGPVVLGTLGSEKRLDTTVIGDSVNLASRIEGLTKRYRVRILISGDTVRLMKSPGAIAARMVGRVKVKGKQATATVFEVIDGDISHVREGKNKTLSQFQRATGLFYDRDFEDALDLFKQCLAVFEFDPVAQSYVDRCKQQIRTELHDDW